MKKTLTEAVPTFFLTRVGVAGPFRFEAEKKDRQSGTSQARTDSGAMFSYIMQCLILT